MRGENWQQCHLALLFIILLNGRPCNLPHEPNMPPNTNHRISCGKEPLSAACLPICGPQTSCLHDHPSLSASKTACPFPHCAGGAVNIGFVLPRIISDAFQESGNRVIITAALGLGSLRTEGDALGEGSSMAEQLQGVTAFQKNGSQAISLVFDFGRLR